MLYNVLNFLLFIEIFQNFENFYPLSIVLDRFDDVGDRFEHRFDHCFDPFVLISGMMFKLTYRLGFTSIFILHDLMTVSL